MARPTILDCLGRYFDARRWLKWSTLTLQVSVSGSFSYTTGAGHTISGTIGGTATLTLTRKVDPYDRTEPPDYVDQGVGTLEFQTYRSRCGCPQFLFHPDARESVAGSLEASITDSPPPESEDDPSTVTGSADVFFDWILASDPCPEAEVIVQALSFSAPDLLGVELFVVGDEARLTPPPGLAYAGDTYTETVSYDLLSPVDSAVCGSQDHTFSISGTP